MTARGSDTFGKHDMPDLTEKELALRIERRAATDSGFAIAHALLQLAKAQQGVAMQLKYLGNGDAATTVGAIEGFGMLLGEKIDMLVDAIGGR